MYSTRVRKIVTLSVVILFACVSTLSGYEYQPLTLLIQPEQMDNYDKKVLKIAEKVAQECTAIIEQLISEGIKTEKEIFSTLYFPIEPLRSPPTFHTFYDDVFDRYIQPVLDRYLKEYPDLIYVVIVDRNGYLPTHNSKYSQPLTGNPEVDIKINRTKRIFNDITGIIAARNRERFILQVYRRDTGEILADLSVPIFVRGKHWGAVRIGYHRKEEFQTNKVQGGR